MNQFVERLPWRIAALAGLVVGAASFFAGTDLWVCLLRVGAAFAVFALGGLGLRSLLSHGLSGQTSGRRPGAHVDQSTPPMSVEDIVDSPEGAGPGAASRGDESKQ